MTMRWISLVPSPMIISGGVAVVALDGELLRVPVAAVDAHRLGRELERRLRAEQLGHAGLDVGPLAALELLGGRPHQQA